MNGALRVAESGEEGCVEDPREEGKKETDS